MKQLEPAVAMNGHAEYGSGDLENKRREPVENTKLGGGK